MSTLRNGANGQRVRLAKAGARSDETRWFTLWVAPNGTLATLTDEHTGKTVSYDVAGEGRLVVETGAADLGDRT